MTLSRRALLGSGAAATLAACAGGRRSATADALGDSDGVGLAARIRSGEISASEALEAAIARAERVNPRLNFIATKAYALGRARAATNPAGPLGGVPTFIKDLTPLAGVRQMNGSRAFADNVAQENGPYTDSVLSGGLVPFAKSTTPEFGFTCTTEPILTGATKNPWDVTRIAGGSSGGSAAAVAAGVVPVAHANDGGGSVRIPASICGLVGLKLSRGRFIDRPDNSPVSLGVEGCVSRSVRDTAAWLAITERIGNDRRYNPVGMVEGASTRRLRIGFSTADAIGVEPHPEVRAATEAAAALCRDLGHAVLEKRLAYDGQEFIDAFVLVWASGAAEIEAQVRAAAPQTPIEDLLEPLTLQLAERANRAGPAALRSAITVLQGTEATYAGLFSDCDVILTPTLSKPPLRLGEVAPTLPYEVGFGRVLDYVRYTPIVNSSGGTAISLPLGVSGDGLPIGMHFMAQKGEERMLLELAYELEAAQPWAARKPRIWAGP